MGRPRTRCAAARSTPACTAASCSARRGPSSSCTARMSAPWSSMWVAHEWRSTCGLSRSPRPARLAVARARSARRPGAYSRPPRRLRNTASASPRRAHRSGASTSRPPGAELGAERVAGEAADRHDPLLGALAEGPDQGALGGRRRRGYRPDQLGDAQPGAVEHLEHGPVAAGHRLVADHRGEQAVDLVLGQRLGQALRAPGAPPRRRPDRPPGALRRPGTGSSARTATRATRLTDGRRPAPALQPGHVVVDVGSPAASSRAPSPARATAT